MGWPAVRQCSVACCDGGVSQHPTCPHSAHCRRCTHQPPVASHSTQPVPLGWTATLMPSVTISQLPRINRWSEAQVFFDDDDGDTPGTITLLTMRTLLTPLATPYACRARASSSG